MFARPRAIAGIVGIVAIAAMMGGCGGGESSAGPEVRGESNASPPISTSASSTTASTTGTASSTAPASPTTAATESSTTSAAASSSVAATEAMTTSAADTSSVAAAEAMATSTAPASSAAVETAAATTTSAASESSADWAPVSISAGEVDDNDRWAEYLAYRQGYSGPPVHDLDVSERYIITVVGPGGLPIPNATVRTFGGEALLSEGRTYANGQTLFFPRLSTDHAGVTRFNVTVEKGGVSQTAEFGRNGDSEWTIEFDGAPERSGDVPLDVLFLLDATGSMADEIEQIKTTLLSISTRISDLPSQPDLRFGMVAYRDRGDEFVTRTYDFEADTQTFLNSIRGVQADGGGDEAESLNEALHAAVNGPEWRGGDALRLVFLIADAPPHLDYAQDYDYAVEMVEASRRGIKVFPIASSGLNSQGEYIFRQVAVHTMGRFLFILYGGQTPHQVGQYSVENLDDLVVKLVEEELAHLAIQ